MIYYTIRFYTILQYTMIYYTIRYYIILYYCKTEPNRTEYFSKVYGAETNRTEPVPSCLPHAPL